MAQTVPSVLWDDHGSDMPSLSPPPEMASGSDQLSFFDSGNSFGAEQGAGFGMDSGPAAAPASPWGAQSAYGGAIGSGGSVGSSASSFDEDEEPLLVELGINFDHIWQKTRSVLVPFKALDAHIMEDTDLAGPICFCLLLGFALLFTGKLHFGYIYGFGLTGCLMMWAMLNLMSENGASLEQTMSILGYCLLPLVLLSALAIFANLNGSFGYGLAFTSVAWCTVAAANFMEKAFNMREQRFLVAYPSFLLYSVFALLTIF